jgi:hypothetical protein
LTESSTPQLPTDFSLVLGGPLYQFFVRSHMTGSALELLRRRVIFIAMVAWLPLLVLSALTGGLLSRSIAMPFLLDAEVHVRFLLVVPLLVGAELIVHRRMRDIPYQFMARRLIPEDARARFDAALTSLIRLRNSTLAELLLIAFVYGVGVLVIWRHFIVVDTNSWYTVPAVLGSKFSAAGLWYGYVSMPIFQFLLLRWYYRIFLWARFLWQVSRIKLSLVPTHPDRLAGLGFLSNSVYAFMPLGAAHGLALSGMIANRIFYLGMPLTAFKVEFVVIVIFVQCLIFLPLLLLSPQLVYTKRLGRLEYGTLAERYVRDFDTKWLRDGAPQGEQLLGSSDIQSLADFGNSYQVIRDMHILPVTKEMVIQLAVATALPVVPLLLTMMPLEDLVKRLFGVFV